MPLFRRLLLAAGVALFPGGVWACAPVLTLNPAAPASVRVTVEAACAPDTRILIAQDAFVVTERLDASGHFSGVYPALSPMVEVTATLPDTPSVLAQIEVPTATAYNRFVLQWLGPGEPELAGAGHYGAADVVFPLRALVLSTRASDSLSPEVVMPVTPETCSRDLIGETLVIRRGDIERRDLTVSLPACDAVGERLHLRGLAD
ncbi:hypothetical protein CG51_07870 [Haematobacter missouriensis]|uniref:Lipoprotein n=1 Tax=Haematobacter missouriensis TaxID=366616 RepID=A0A212AV18_9RHOB|nr:hypothetical protein [Haematobacter missouriensis]KFI28518.1 hypothetical protein CG51_07870 [Haematobacter missouriensis]OWJ74909.1 hypothetical protein CDV53_11910 [Haematobacter missouriensis]OWJ85324.1 hypothetical protein CDV52_05195 [Haematobacter missouriensis]